MRIKIAAVLNHKGAKRRLRVSRELEWQDKRKIGWIGMGRMGYPMAERLLKAGYDVSVNRTRSKASHDRSAPRW